MKWSPSWILANLAKALVTTLLFAVVLYFIPGRSGSVWVMALGFGVGTLIFQFARAAFGQLQADRRG